MTAQPPLAAALAAARAIAPPGVVFRTWSEPADFDRMVGVFREARIVDGTTWDMTAESIESDVHAFGSVPERTVLIAEVGGRMVGWVRAYDFGFAPDDGRMLNHSGHVLPEFRRRGIGHALLAGAQAELIRFRTTLGDPAGSSAGLHAWVFAANRTTSQMLERDGYRPHRFVVELTRGLDDLPPDTLPPGIAVRPVETGDLPAILGALDRAMHDHRGWPAMDEAQLLTMFDHPIRGQTDIWQVAWAGDDVVGGVLGYIDRDENETLGRQRGYTEGIFTIREWRGRGIASALIGRNLRLLRARGMTEAALSVDTENPSGALGLYERHGFREDDRLVILRKELEPAR